MQERKRVCAGTEDFGAFIESGGCYVDKTRFLRPLLTRTGVVALFTRPRRFGKTLTMTMLRDFLKVDRENPGSTDLQERLFKGLAVMEDRELCARFMGQHPVIFITLKDAGGDTFEAAADSLASTVSDVASEHRYLLESRKLCDPEKKRLEAFIGMQDGLGSAPQVMLEKSVLNLARMLHAHFGRKVVVLVDEYDVPLARAQRGGCHSKMTELYSKFMGFLKKTSGTDPICRVIMTGCLRVAKNQIFTGANNFTPYTVLSQGTIFSTLFGFTPEETEAYLSTFGLSGYGEMVKAQYDGYRFGHDEIYNPWDVSKFVASAVEAGNKAALRGTKAKITPANFWVGSESSGTLAIKSYLGTLADEETQKLQDVCDGKEVETDINDSMNYDSLSRHNAKDMWSLLLHTGYLTATKVVTPEKCVVRIPNKEIMKCFRDSIMAGFNDALSSGGKGARLAKALFDGDGRTCEEIMGLMLRRYVSNRVRSARTPENFYEGFMSGLLASIGYRQDELGVEHEAGDGFSDIVIKDPDGRRAAVLELKSSGADRSMVPDARMAVAQIEEKRYARELLENERLEHVWAVGIAFYGKICSVAMKDMRDPGNGMEDPV